MEQLNLPLTPHSRVHRVGQSGGKGRMGADIIVAGAGDDTVLGDKGQAVFTLSVASSVTTLFSGTGADDIVFLGEGNNFDMGGAGNDVVLGGTKATPSSKAASSPSRKASITSWAATTS